MTELWTLILIVAGLAQPIIVEGYTSAKWCNEVLTEAKTTINADGFCTKLPPDPYGTPS